jgi:NAD(P)-dependent dehydrogenase (short-subunit alcohol dehydrogenase family)
MATFDVDLSGIVAVVTGASRGAGRGTALVLGQAGATVYVTARSVRGRPSAPGREGSVEETAEAVEARGGTAIPVACDHTDDDAVRSLFERVRTEQGRLDILVNNAWGGYEQRADEPEVGFFGVPFWEQPLWRWDAMFTAGACTSAGRPARGAADARAARTSRSRGQHHRLGLWRLPGQRPLRHRQGVDDPHGLRYGRGPAQAPGRGRGAGPRTPRRERVTRIPAAPSRPSPPPRTS